MSSRSPYAPASARARLYAFAWDYLLIAGYLLALACVGAWFSLGPLAAWWHARMSTPARVDALAFCLSVAPVIG